MRIGELSRQTGVSRDALRLYERRGLICALRRDNGYRDYAEGAVQLVQLIKLAQSFGFTLAEIEPDMRAIARHGLGSDRVAARLAGKLAEVDTHIAALQKRRDDMATLLEGVCPITVKR